MVEIPQNDRLKCAYLSLEGLVMGDAYGNHHGNNPHKRVAEKWEYSDDTLMAASIVENLRQYGAINQDALVQSFADHWDGQRGYGRGATRLLKSIQQGVNWREATASIFEGGSYGNGAAMRVAPLGAYFHDDLEMVCEQAHLSSEVTHSHPEAVAGAIAVAVGTAFVCQSQDKKLEGSDFLREIMKYVPESEVRNTLQQAIEIPSTVRVREAAKILGNGRPAIAQKTVGFALWMAAHHLDDFEMAISQTASAKGDVDTNCAIVGGIVVMATGLKGIPQDWMNRREALPDWVFSSVNE